MKALSYYIKMKYPLEIKVMPDGHYCAQIPTIPGLCAYGKTIPQALEELEMVKQTAFELMLSQNKEIPLPKIRLEIPLDAFQKLPNRKDMEQFVI